MFTNVHDADDGIPFIAVRSQRNAAGSESRVWGEVGGVLGGAALTSPCSPAGIPA
ncbi:MAG: hypothetical protein R2695_08930 [Acidimicrobiales bacterium]